jgi:hypothetical protein
MELENQESLVRIYTQIDGRYSNIIEKTGGSDTITENQISADSESVPLLPTVQISYLFVVKSSKS